MVVLGYRTARDPFEVRTLKEINFIMNPTLANNLFSHCRTLERIQGELSNLRDPAGAGWVKAILSSLTRESGFTTSCQVAFSAVVDLLNRQCSERQKIVEAIIPLMGIRLAATVIKDSALSTQAKNLADKLVQGADWSAPTEQTILQDLRAIRLMPSTVRLISSVAGAHEQSARLIAEGRLVGAWTNLRNCGGTALDFAALAAEAIDKGIVTAAELFSRMKGRTEHMPTEAVNAIAEVCAVRLTMDDAVVSALACTSFIKDPVAKTQLQKVVALGVGVSALEKLGIKITP